MDQAGSVIGFIRRCFSAEEWQVLVGTPAFKQRLQAVQDMDEAERLITFALALLSENELRLACAA